MTESTSAEWNAKLYESKHAFVWEHGASVVQWLAPQQHERVLDLGCGTGQLTASIAASCAEVVGLDRSPQMIDEARRNFPGIRFVQADAQDFEFEQRFDAVFSNAALHWIQHPAKVVDAVARTLKPGGRLVVEFGGAGNVRQLTAAIKQATQDTVAQIVSHPWYFPTIAQYTDVLEQHGLEPIRAALIDRPTRLDGSDGLRNWVRMFGGQWLEIVPADRQEEFFRRIETLARPALSRDGDWYADYRRLRVAAVKP